MHPLKKAFFVALGCISLALGTIGIALPILPTVPFYLLTAFCFANSSERLHTWFTHTTVYKKYIGSYFRRRGMTRKAKALLIGTVTAIMLPGFILMDKVPVGRAIMAIVWAADFPVSGNRKRIRAVTASSYFLWYAACKYLSGYYEID